MNKYKFIVIALLSLFQTISVVGQNSNSINVQEKKKIDDKINEFIYLIEIKDLESLKNLTEKRIYCSLCHMKPGNGVNPYMISKRDFYENHFTKIFDSNLLNRIKKAERIIIKEKSNYSDYVVLFTIYDADEITKEHEGAQFGFLIKKNLSTLKLSGVEVIP